MRVTNPDRVYSSSLPTVQEIFEFIRKTHWLTRAVFVALLLVAVAMNLWMYYPGTTSGYVYPRASITTYSYDRPALYGFPFAHFSTGIFSTSPDVFSEFFFRVYRKSGTFLPWHFVMNFIVLFTLIGAASCLLELLIRRRLRPRFHLSTAVVMMLLGGALLTRNMNPKGPFQNESEFRSQSINAAYADDFEYASQARAELSDMLNNSLKPIGWPYTAWLRDSDYSGKIRLFAINTIIGILFLAAAASLLEMWLRQTAPLSNHPLAEAK